MVVVVTGDVAADGLLGDIDAGLRDVANGDLLDVVVGLVFLLTADVRHALAAHADEADENAVIGANHFSCGRSGALAVNRGFKNVAGRDDGGSGGCGLDEFASCADAGGCFFIFHKFLSWLLMLDKNRKANHSQLPVNPLLSKIKARIA